MHLRKKKHSFPVNNCRTEGCLWTSQWGHRTQPGRVGKGGASKEASRKVTQLNLKEKEGRRWKGSRERKGRGTIWTERWVCIRMDGKVDEKRENVKVLEVSYGWMQGNVCFFFLTPTFFITAKYI